MTTETTDAALIAQFREQHRDLARKYLTDLNAWAGHMEFILNIDGLGIDTIGKMMESAQNLARHMHILDGAAAVTGFVAAIKEAGTQQDEDGKP